MERNTSEIKKYNVFFIMTSGKRGLRKEDMCQKQFAVFEEVDS